MTLPLAIALIIAAANLVWIAFTFWEWLTGRRLRVVAAQRENAAVAELDSVARAFAAVEKAKARSLPGEAADPGRWVLLASAVNVLTGIVARAVAAEDETRAYDAARELADLISQVHSPGLPGLISDAYAYFLSRGGQS